MRSTASFLVSGSTINASDAAKGHRKSATAS